MSLSHELVQAVFALLDEPSHSSLIYSLYRASLLKCLAVLASQMNTITFSQHEVLRRLLDTSLIVSNTPGEMITPFLSSTILPYVLQQSECTLKTPQDDPSQVHRLMIRLVYLGKFGNMSKMENGRFFHFRTVVYSIVVFVVNLALF